MISITIQKLPSAMELEQLPQNILTGMLLSGDRILCCEYAAIATDADKLAGVCTIAPDGEQNSGKPTIVALYVLPEYRCRSIGKRLLIQAIQFMLDRNLKPIHIDLMSSNVSRLIRVLPDRLTDIVLTEHHGILDMWQHL